MEPFPTDVRRRKNYVSLVQAQSISIAPNVGCLQWLRPSYTIAWTSLVPWYVDDYAELNGEQETYLEELLTPFLAWHRAQELPSYVKILGDIETSLDEPETQAGVEAIFAEFERAWLRLEGEALDSLLDLGAQLSDTQIDGFLKVLWEQQDEYKEEYLERPDDEFYEDSYDNLKDNAKEYLGALSDKQRNVLRESSSKLLRSDEEWLRERADWFKQLEVILKRGPQWQTTSAGSGGSKERQILARICAHLRKIIVLLLPTQLRDS